MKKPKQILTVALVAILVVFFCFSKTNASINESFTFQGKIVDDDGTNLTNSDATCVNDSGADTCDFRVSLYDATTGGNLLWQETKQDIEIGDNDGIFNLTLDCAGTFSNCYQGAYDESIFSNGTDIYIQIEFDPSGNNDYAEGEIFSPRREMSSVPYAFHSKTADSATDSDTLDSIDSTSFLRSDLSDTFESGNTLTFAGDIDSNGQISIADTDIALDGASTNLTATGDFSINTDDLTIDKATGNVGIGDSTPSFTLDINGDAQIQGGELYLTGITSSSSTTEGTIYYDNDDDNLYVYADGSWVDLTVQGGSSLWTDGTNGYYSNTEGIIVGPDTAETLDNTGFTLSAGDLFVSDQLGVEGSIYTDGEFVSGASLHLSDNHILDTNGDINIQADNDTDDYLRIDTTSDLPTIYWEGVSTYTNDPGIGVDASGNLVYRDQDETSWTKLDSLHNSGDFANNGEAAGGSRGLGNTDNYALSLKTNDTERIYIGPGEIGADANSVLLIHSDDTDGFTTFTDSSNSGHTITANGDVHHETDQKKFGASSIDCTVNGSSLSIADHDDFEFEGEQFTIDFWVMRNGDNFNVGSRGGLIAKWANSAYSGRHWNVHFDPDHYISVAVADGNSGDTGGVLKSNSIIETGVWHHIALVRESTTSLKLYVDGVQQGSTYTTDTTMMTIWDKSVYACRLFSDTSGFHANAYLDEVRISKGIARWTTNFSPPGAPYSGVDLGAKVGIGTTSPNATLDVELSATGISTDKTIFTANTTGSTFDTSTQSLTNYSAYLTNASTESAGTNDLTNIALYASASGGDNNYAAIFENGSVGIGTTTPGALLDIQADSATDYAVEVLNDGNNTNRYGMLISAGEDTGSGTLIQFNDGDGTDVGEITFSGTTTTYGTSSDRRMKENIISTSMGIEDLMKVQVRDYEFKSDNTNMTYTGFIAQELIEVFPHAVFAPDDGRMWSVDYGKITPLLAKAIQDQQGMIDNLNTNYNTLTTTLSDQTTTNQEKFTVIGSTVEELNNNLTTRLNIQEEELNNQKTEINNINNSLTALTTTIENLNDLTTLMTDTLTNHEQRIQNLESQISNLTGNPIDPDNPTNNLTTIPDNLETLSNNLTTETIITTEIDPETGEETTTESYLFDVEGNLKAKEIEVAGITTNKEVSGKGLICGTVSENPDCEGVLKNDEVTIETSQVKVDSQIYITPIGSTFGKILYIEKETLIEGESFVVRFDGEMVNEDINFNWLIIN